MLAAYWQRARRIIVHTLLHADDTPRQIALGAAVATFVAFLPIIGHTFLAIPLAALLRANKAICVPFVWITNPVTAMPIYTGCYWLGRFVLGGAPAETGADLPAHVSGLPVAHAGWGRFVDPVFWKDLFYSVLHIGAELWVGCALAGLIVATVVYFVMASGVSKYRERHRRHLLQHSLPRVPSTPPGISPSRKVAHSPRS